MLCIQFPYTVPVIKLIKTWLLTRYISRIIQSGGIKLQMKQETNASF